MNPYICDWCFWESQVSPRQRCLFFITLFHEPLASGCREKYRLLRYHINVTQTQRVKVFLLFQDPTLPRTDDHPCPRCNAREAVFFQAQTRRAEDEMRLYYVCCNAECTHRWTEWCTRNSLASLLHHYYCHSFHCFYYLHKSIECIACCYPIWFPPFTDFCSNKCFFIVFVSVYKNFSFLNI